MTSLLLCFGLKREGAGASSSEPRAFFFFFRPLMAEPASASDSLSLIRPSSASFLFLCSRKEYNLRMSWSLITFGRFRSRGAVLELLRRLVYFFKHGTRPFSILISLRLERALHRLCCGDSLLLPLLSFQRSLGDACLRSLAMRSFLVVGLFRSIHVLDKVRFLNTKRILQCEPE